MFNHIMIGTNDIDKSKAFYEKVLKVVGVEGAMDNTLNSGIKRVFFMHDGDVLALSQPIDGEVATCANGMTIGVCNEVGTCGWGLFLNYGTLDRDSLTADGQVSKAQPPEGWPNGDETQVMVNEAGQPANLWHRANGAVIEVVVDHSDGSLAFGVNGAPPRRVPNVWPRDYDFINPEAWHPPGHVPPAKVPFKLPQGAQLRPWALLGYGNDRLRFVRGFL